jgi:hypothetical protein
MTGPTNPPDQQAAYINRAKPPLNQSTKMPERNHKIGTTTRATKLLVKAITPRPKPKAKINKKAKKITIEKWITAVAKPTLTTPSPPAPPPRTSPSPPPPRPATPTIEITPLAPKPTTPTNQNNENDSIHCCEDHLCNYCNKCTYCDCDNSCRTQTITRTVRLRPRATSSEPEEIDSSDNESEPTNQEHENQTTQPSPNLTKPQPAKKATIINLDDYRYIIRTNKTIKRERQREQAKLLKQHHEMMREIAMNY